LSDARLFVRTHVAASAGGRRATLALRVPRMEGQTALINAVRLGQVSVSVSTAHGTNMPGYQVGTVSLYALRTSLGLCTQAPNRHV
jgi:hypothetical protein